MARKFEQDIMRKMKLRRLKRFWSRVVSVMMCIVVFVTTYALILPAITKESETFCALEEHTHTADCYPQEGDLLCELADGEIHEHTQDCNPVKQEEPICGLEETDPSVHGDDCVILEEEILVCTAPEGHVHDDTCVPQQEQELVCTLAVAEGHSHSDACAPQEEWTQICTLEEDETHSHDDACYSVTTIYGCGLQETAGHAHTDACYTVITVYGCGLEEVPLHSHTEECYEVVTSCSCGIDETAGHTHSDDCYDIIYSCGLEAGAAHVHEENCFVTSPALCCELEENSEHTHGDDCYRYEPVCGLEVHKHELECYSDPDADLETAEMWEMTLPSGLTGVRANDLLAVAKSQLGYAESSRNYAVDESGEMKGYTRYGAWYDTPYADWDSLFVAFCLHYAGAENYPWRENYSGWMGALTEQGLYKIPAEYVPGPGDLIFLDLNGNGGIDHAGIVEEQTDSGVTVIAGDIDDCVARRKFGLTDSAIIAYGKVTEESAIPEDTGAADDLPEVSGSWESAIARAELVAPAGSGTAKRARFAAAGEGSDEPATYQVAGRATYAPLPLEPHIVGVKMIDTKTNQEIPSGSVVEEDDLIKFTISYAIAGKVLADQEKINSNTMTYTLPAIFKAVATDEGYIIDKNKNVGTYVIGPDSNGNITITMTFFDDFVNENANSMQISGDISFFSTVTKVTENETEDQEYNFTDKITLGLTVTENNEAQGDLSIKKEVARVTGEEITYRVIVTSEEGTTGPVTFTDTMSTGLTFKQGVSVKNGSGQTINAQFNPSADRSSFTMTLPDMAPGDSYTLEYKCTADIDLLGDDMLVNNRAKVNSFNNYNVPLEQETTVDYKFKLLEKTGKANEDGTVTWTITINRDKVDISGWTLEDSMGVGQNKQPFTGPVDIKGSNGSVKWANVTLPYKFPNGSTDTYTIVYTTPFGADYGDRFVNAAKLKYDDTEVGVESGVGVPGNPFTKTADVGVPIQDEDGNYLLPIEWTVTIDTSLAAIPGGWSFYDILQGNIYSGAEQMYMTYDQLMGAVDSFEDALMEITGQGVADYSAYIYVPGANHGNEYSDTQLENNVNGCQSGKFDRFEITLGSEGIPKGNTLTFKYEAYGVFPDEFVSTELFANRFSLQGHYEVEVPVEYGAGSVKAIKYAMTSFIPDPSNHEMKWDKIDWGSRDGTISLNYADLVDSYLAWAIELSVPPGYSSTADVTVYEDLPDGVSVKSIEFPLQNKVPKTTMHFENMAPGNTYTWPFDLYTAEQYVQNWNMNNPQRVEMTVEVTNAGDLVITLPGEMLKVMGEYAELMNLPQDENYGYLYIYTQIDNDFDWPVSAQSSNVYVNSFTNSISIEDEGDRVHDFTSQTQTIRKEETEGLLTKKASFSNSDTKNTIDYSVLLNPYGKNLLPNAQRMEIIDTLTYTSTEELPFRMRLLDGSVHLYEVDITRQYVGGKLVTSYNKLREIPLEDFQYEEEPVENGDITNWTHTITLNAPDDRALALEYTYYMTGEMTNLHNVNNTCEIRGSDMVPGEDNVEVQVKVEDAVATASTEGVTLTKVDTDNNQLYIPGAKFEIGVYHKQEDHWHVLYDKQNPGNKFFVTDRSGKIYLNSENLSEFAYNTAYYIVEIEAPSGYYLRDDKYYFYIANDNTTDFIPCMPEPDSMVYEEIYGNGMSIAALQTGDIIERYNTSQLTKISVEKYWKDAEGNIIKLRENEVPTVNVELWQRTDGVANSDVLYGIYQVKTDDKGNWRVEVDKLPRAVNNADGTRTNYLYYIKEIKVDGYKLESVENNDGINYGTIKLTNREQNGYELPKTGGAGTQLYTMAGLLFLMSSASYLMYSNRKRRRGAV
ncbi:MAG: LPXTG cell wall anchor domain-containing protein [Oscillospiraceae bacterium]|nr:LPXTG cell wall anchor domain-containing protein [Oscillospiraceae bacterium]